MIIIEFSKLEIKKHFYDNYKLVYSAHNDDTFSQLLKKHIFLTVPCSGEEQFEVPFP